jgi:trk system potassium uptake protein TrkA
MQVIVCGAGQVGLTIARHLAAENNRVTVIDKTPELIQKIGESEDFRAIAGFASHPDVLERAGARDADMIVAVTYSDEVNMIACKIAHALFDVPVKIARVRAQSYLDPQWSKLFEHDHMPIDVTISPEIEVARAIRQRLRVPGAFDTLSLAGGRVRAIGTRIEANCPIVNTPLRQLTALFPDLHLIVVTILREGKTIVPTAEDVLLIGDEVYFIAEESHLTRALAAFGHEEPEANRVVIVGAGNIGLYLAQEIEGKDTRISLKLVESGKERARHVAALLGRTTVVQGDVLDSEILDELNLERVDTLITVTNHDEVNVLASLLAKRRGCKRTIALINTLYYQTIVNTLGIDAVVSPRAITVSTILQHLRRGRIRAAHSLRDGAGELLEAEALDTSAIAGKRLEEIKLDRGIIIGAVVRGDEVLMPRGDTVIEAKDRVVLFALPDQVRKVEKLFTVGLEFF